MAGHRKLTCEPGTLDQYSWAVKGQLLPFLAQKGVTDPSQLRTRHMEGFAVALLEGIGGRAPVGPSTVDLRIRQCGYFIHWLTREGELAQRVDLPQVKVPKKVIQVLDRQGMKRLVAAAKGERNQVILSLLTSTGIRADELCQLKVTDVYRQGNRHLARINGKGAKQRLVGIQVSLFNRLTKWILNGRPKTDAPWLFPTKQSGYQQPITPSGLRYILRQAAGAAGIDQPVWTHLLRHSATTAMLKGRVPQQAIIQHMGWADDKMLRKHYAHLSAEDAHDAIMEFLDQDQHQGAWTGRYRRSS